ncbi:MAG TPA: biopolymer transporter ExbD [Gemmataceae bacterium]|nr:biopolymer transporter ExbD [Gemmataceae bacterium]
MILFVVPPSDRIPGQFRLKAELQTCKNPPRVELPIVPIPDLSFQSMFFLVITFNVAGYEGRLSLSLPSRGRTVRIGVPAPAAADAGVDFPSDLVVSVRTEGDQRVHLAIRDGERIMEAKDCRELTQQLSSRRAEPAVDPISLTIDVDGQIKYSRLIEVLDACKRAGFENISFAMPGES